MENNETERLAPQTFNMESLLHQMSEIDEMYHRASPSTGMFQVFLIFLILIEEKFCVVNTFFFSPKKLRL